jgi:hypothetical protein
MFTLLAVFICRGTDKFRRHGIEIITKTIRIHYRNINFLLFWEKYLVILSTSHYFPQIHFIFLPFLYRWSSFLLSRTRTYSILLYIRWLKKNTIYWQGESRCIFFPHSTKLSPINNCSENFIIFCYLLYEVPIIIPVFFRA